MVDIEHTEKQHSHSGDPPTIPLRNFTQPHGDSLRQALNNVFSTPLAERVYGQIVDGMLLQESAMDTYDGLKFPGHPLHKEHLELSGAVLQRVQELRDTFPLDNLCFPASLVHRFQTAAPGSRAFNTSLIELVARAVHEIAVIIHQQACLRAPDDPLLRWRPSDVEDPDDANRIAWAYQDEFPPIYFYHEWYTAYSQYPHGVSDAVGYWAENKILGGVVLFDRRKPASSPDVDPDAIYFHTDARRVTYRIYRLLDSQKRDLVNFLLSSPSDPSPAPCPLPIHGDQNNRTRFDPEEALEDTGIYRDKWEREGPKYMGPHWDPRLRDVYDVGGDYISYKEYREAASRAVALRDRLEKEEDLRWEMENKQMEEEERDVSPRSTRGSSPRSAGGSSPRSTRSLSPRSTRDFSPGAARG